MFFSVEYRYPSGKKGMELRNYQLRFVKTWSRSGLDLIQKIDDIGNINPGSGRQRSARALLMPLLNVRGAGAESEGAPQTHSSQRQIARQLGVPCSRVCEPYHRERPAATVLQKAPST